ncbi:MAG TPA: methyltransferase domain-containing protein [Candidatus Nanoarchaeia archaeon]|nr:methyltransferase domain-containing protein [Candidatus Nanoarchaeia archaeon]
MDSDKAWRWDRLYLQEPSIFEGVDDKIEKILSYKKSGSALDLGCGTGDDLLFLAERGFEVHGVDISDVALGHFKKKADAKKQKVRAVHADLSSYILEQDYDAIILVSILQFIPREDALKLFAQMQERTRLGGINMISCFKQEPPAYQSSSRAFFAREGELLQIYSNWSILEYGEPILGVGNIQTGEKEEQKLAFLLAQKP